MKDVAAIILAAGASTRLGEPKQLVCLGAENLLERAVKIAMEAGYTPIVVVLGSSADLIRAKSKLTAVQVVINQDWTEGLSSSIRTGVAALQSEQGVLVMTCDMPAVTPQHLCLLASEPHVCKGTLHGKRAGVPAYFPKQMFSDLMELRGDAGAKELLKDASCVELSGGVFDIDTQEELRVAKEQFGS